MIDEGRLLEYVKELESSGFSSILLEDLRLYIQHMSAVGEWVRCSDNLPESDNVLCCNIHGDQAVGSVVKDGISHTGFSADSEGGYMFDCIAWQPLPERYGADRQ